MGSKLCLMRRWVHSWGLSLACEVDGEGPLVLAAHGFPDSAETYDEQVPALVEAGYRVARVTMRGYWPSDPAPDGVYDMDAFGRDLLAVAEALSPEAPVRLIGHDWGALACYAASGLNPERVASMVCMAVPHLRATLPRFAHPSQLRASWYIAFFQARGIAERRLAADDMAFVDRLWRDWSPSYRPSLERLRRVKAGIAGREREVLAYYRPPYGRAHARRTRVPTLYLHGAEDGCIVRRTIEGSERAFDAPVRVEVIEGAGHFLQLERPAAVNAAILDHFGPAPRGERG